MFKGHPALSSDGVGSYWNDMLFYGHRPRGSTAPVPVLCHPVFVFPVFVRRLASCARCLAMCAPASWCARECGAHSPLAPVFLFPFAFHCVPRGLSRFRLLIHPCARCATCMRIVASYWSPQVFDQSSKNAIPMCSCHACFYTEV